MIRKHYKPCILILAGLIVLFSGVAAGRQRTNATAAPTARAKNIVLFLGDGMGLSTVNAASIYGHKRAGALFIQHLPYLGFSDTSSANNWVTDSAAGMTAIMTGRKTLNGVISESPDTAVRGKEDGAALKTLIEYAEEKGMATGIITNDDVTGATPAACYSHVNDRAKRAEIAVQFLAPRFGDGVDLLAGRDQGYFVPKTAGGKREDTRDVTAEARARGYRVVTSPSEIATGKPGQKILALFPDAYEPEAVVAAAISILSRNPRGFFLMVEWDCHQKTAKESLENALRLDRTAEKARLLTNAQPTLLLVTSDHSYDLRFPQGARLDGDILPAIRIDGHHTAEEVLIAADGPGAERVHGFMKNTDIFQVIRSALGWPQ